jgi:SAM-dependent methyltransferase
MPEMICRICGNSENNKEFQIREMMFGFRDLFTYLECSECGCLQIAEIPTNMDKYYPSNYYSFHPMSASSLPERFLVRSRDRQVLFHTGFVGKLLSKRYPNHSLELISKTGIDYRSRILDVGCGSGGLLFFLRNAGMRSLMGIDAYLSEEVIEGEFNILRKNIGDLSNDQEFDLIMFNHSLEHIPEQLETLRKVYHMLARNGVCLVAMPLKTEYVWNLYGVNWVEIDAPRHFFVHTMRSFAILAEEAGFVIDDVIFDSTEFQFWGSEQYKNDIPLEADNSWRRNQKKSMFSRNKMREFKRMAEELNKAKLGDQATFYLVRDTHARHYG